MVTRKLSLLIILLLSLAMPIMSVPAHAETRVCRVKPTLVVTTNNGDIYISGDVTPSGHWYWQRVCNVSVSALDVTIDTCKSWLSTALTAQSTGKTVFMIYEDGGNPARLDCGAFESWKDAPISYLGLEG